MSRQELCAIIPRVNISIKYRTGRLRIGRGGSRTAATSKMERFMMMVNGWKTLTIIAKHSILDVTVVLDPPLIGTAPLKEQTSQ